MTNDRTRGRGAPDLADAPDALELDEVWTALEPGPVDRPGEDTDAAWRALSARLFDESEEQTAPPAAPVPSRPDRRLRTRTGWAVLPIAAAAVAAISLVPVTETAAAGARLDVALPGGSTVALNSGSTLSWTRGFGWIPGVPGGDRVVRLEGEAFFDVERNGRAFRVETRDATVSVLGTRFNVRARADVPTRVTVEEGRVAVADRAGTERIELTAGQRGGFFDEGGLAVEVDGDLSELTWRRGGLSLRDLPLTSILEEIERRFDTTVRVADPEIVRGRMTLHYSHEVALDTVLADLAAARGIRYRATPDGWELYRE